MFGLKVYVSSLKATSTQDETTQTKITIAFYQGERILIV